ncbi:MAG: hypothetical protein HY403_09180 [Elusimicrobia bacterium]|nr:hypothetical protein [Elusimicrobiota bacterium]
MRHIGIVIGLACFAVVQASATFDEQRMARDGAQIVKDVKKSMAPHRGLEPTCMIEIGRDRSELVKLPKVDDQGDGRPVYQMSFKDVKIEYVPYNSRLLIYKNDALFLRTVMFAQPEGSFTSFQEHSLFDQKPPHKLMAVARCTFARAQ